jgi:hypothetical protein
MRYILAVVIALITFYSQADTIVKPTVATKIHKPHAQVHPAIPKKPKLLRSNPLRLSAIKLLDCNPVDLPDDEDLMPSPVHRQKITKKPWDDDTELSPEITVRLAVARARAMARYREQFA